ncbi:Hypothetical predicted protein [Mytilus galloprovincialis]|uniref:Reverse transcriptase domain-containing protein n=1 Tax=Mytilus galloprovincialis TaxID=29158 RepID=A0A8B6D1Y4_MYTGA|nr:Hypothetical predicted protein [Mytilus galloprovincialis]
MNLVLRGLTWNVVLAFLDDILVMGKTFEDHLQNLTSVFERFREYGLKLKPRKCDFFQKEIDFLGRTINRDGMAIGSEYVEVVKKWKVPTTTREVEQFLGFANYHRTFIKNFADLSYPLYQLTGREFIVRTDHSSLTWLLHFKEPQGQLARWLEELSQYHMTVKHRPGKRHQNADALSRLPDLACPQNRLAAGNVLKHNLPCGACDYCTRAHQSWLGFQEEDVDNVIPLASHQDCKSFEPIGPHTVLPSSLISDDNLMKQDNTQHIHVITEDNTRPDSSIPQDEDQNVTSHVKENLSTFQVQQQVFESTNQDIVNQNQNVCHSSVEIVTTPLGMSVYATYLDFPNVNAITETGIEASTYSPEQLRDYQSKDPDLELILVWFRDKTEPSEATIFRCSPIAKKYWINKDMFYLDDNGILRNLDKKDRTPRLVVPRDLVEQVISLCHDIPAAGHQGMNRTTLRIKAKYQWYGMTQKIRDFVKNM